MKAVKVPEGLLGAPFYHNAIALNAVDIIESCTLAHETRGTMFLKDHLLLFVLEGINHVKHGNTIYTVNKNEMVLLKKNINIEYHKIGHASCHGYDSMMFFLKDEFLQDFIKMAGIKELATVEMAKVTVKPVKERLLSFIMSIKPYFNEAEQIDAGLLRLKMLELLYDLASTDKNLLLQLLQLKQQAITDITQVVEDNYTSPLNLEDFAYLSGRSLSSFKRDFSSIYKVPPAQWIREKRLQKARELLNITGWAVADVCYASGFENMAHFSRLYKQFFGEPPSATRSNKIVSN